MPNEPIVWVTLLIGLALIMGLALWLGRGLEISLKDGKPVIKTKESQSKGDLTVKVAEEMKIKDSTIGNVKGVKNKGFDVVSESKQKEVGVANRVEIKNSTVGDIIGVEQEKQS
jgi:hypothetical protein